MFELDPTLERDTMQIGDLDLCRVLLMNDCQYPWVILVPKVSDITEIYQLNPKQQMTLMEESNQVLALMAKELDADKMNVAALGNVVSQLHIHHIVRYNFDKAWPAPVWGAFPVEPYSSEKLELMVVRFQKLFSNIKSFKVSS